MNESCVILHALFVQRVTLEAILSHLITQELLTKHSFNH